jgi:hypothetical protein
MSRSWDEIREYREEAVNSFPLASDLAVIADDVDARNKAWDTTNELYRLLSDIKKEHEAEYRSAKVNIVYDANLATLSEKGFQVELVNGIQYRITW